MHNRTAVGFVLKNINEKKNIEMSSGIKCSEVQIIQNWIISTRKTRLKE
jgi:hypothetical protein